MSGVWVEVTRGEVVESRHRVHVAVVDGAGRTVAAAGSPEYPTFARSAVKAIQAIPLVEDGCVERFGLTDRELALCCASHGGEPWHVETARSILLKAGAEEDALACGPHSPFHEPSARALVEAGKAPGRVHNNCSGKHAGMLMLARAHDWPLAGYQREDHPVQRRMLEEMARWTGVSPGSIATGVDGCGVITFGVPLSSLAGAFARLAGAARSGGESGAPARVIGAMVRHPEYVAGTDRLCTDLMRAASGRIFAKVGAEGVYCAGLPEEGIGIALKAEDGARRAVEPALLGVLAALGFLGEEAGARLARYATPELTNTRGEVIGGIRAVVELERAGG